jgi:long-chain acyl-CoA synthetase
VVDPKAPPVDPKAPPVITSARFSPAATAASDPERAAVIVGGSGVVLTYRDLDDRANRLAQLFRSWGLNHGDHIAILMENNPRYFEVAWAAQRSGLYYTPINSYLTAGEVGYILADCDATVLVTSAASARLGQVAGAAVRDAPKVRHRLVVDGDLDGFDRYEDAVAAFPAAPLDDEREGSDMFYSSGTTGRPKGVRRPLLLQPFGVEASPTLQLFQRCYRFREAMTYLSPAPLYHAAPLVACMAVHRLGGTVVVMERFDAAGALALIERHRVSHAQFVPTMFVRMLKLDQDVRGAVDVSSLESVVHAAAPCPVPVKEEMIRWWGPILLEYYSGTEGNGFTFITSEEWLSHKGSVGRSMFGAIHILDDSGHERPPGEQGTVWFSGGNAFEYHKDPDKTRASRNDAGWSTLWDMGYLDEEGYLYLTDRTAFMIISGGVNIYPQEIENVLVTHPKVLDVAVIGVPNDEFGEEVKAIVQPVLVDAAGPDLAEELIEHCRAQLAAYKCPRSIDFEAELPRLPTGKLYKRLLRDRYWAGQAKRI